MWSGIPLSAWTVFRKWSKEKTYKLGQHGLAHQPGPTNNRLLSGPSFPSRRRGIFACTVCASLADEFFLPPQHPEDEQWIHEALAWRLEKRKNMSLAAFVCVCVTGLVKAAAVSTSIKAGTGGEGQAEEFSISPAAGEGRPPWCRSSEEGFTEEGCASWINSRTGFIPAVVIYIDVLGGWSNSIKYFCFFKNNLYWFGFVCRYRNLPQMMT